MAWKHVSSPPPENFRIVASARKVMATVFCGIDGIVLTDSLEHGSTVTGTYYADLVRKIRASLVEKRRGKLHRKVLFDQGNARAHTSLEELAAIRNAGFTQLHLPPCLPDLAASDY